METFGKERICKFIELCGYNERFEFHVFEYFAENDSSDPDVKEVMDFLMSNKEYSKYLGVMLMGMFQRKYIEKEKDNFVKDSQKLILVEEASKSYNIIIEKFNKLAKELNIFDSLSLSNLFSYMLYTGKFSFNSEHKYKI